MSAEKLNAERSALLQMRDSTTQLLDAYLKGLERGYEEPDLNHGSVPVRVLTVLGIRQFLKAVHDELRDREVLQRTSVDERIVVRVGANERLQVRQRRDYYFVDAPLATIQASRSLHGDFQVAGDDQLFIHNSLPISARVAARYVAGAFLSAFGSLQGRAWVRRAAATAARPSGTTDGGAA